MSSLAAARADNYYNNPDYAYPKGFRKKKKGKKGIITVRYETPFHVKCGGCKCMVAKGVRFNSRKSQGKF